MFENINNDRGLAWCNLWLGQNLFAQSNFNESITCYTRSLPFLEKSGDWEGQGKAWAWLGLIYMQTGDYNSSFEYCDKSLQIRQK